MSRVIQFSCLLLCLVLAPAIATASEAAKIAEAEANLAACLQALPSNARQAFRHPSDRRRVRLSRRVQRQWKECTQRERDVSDLRAIFALRDDLVAMAREAGPAVRREALTIAEHIVVATRRRAEEYRMVGSPLFNNFLVNLGIKKQGFCYHWTSALVHATQDLRWHYFQRQWGVANLQKATENNALIITAREAPVEEGIVFDAWRGAGQPYWRTVRDDHYKWHVRFTAQNLEMGVGYIDEY